MRTTLRDWDDVIPFFVLSAAVRTFEAEDAETFSELMRKDWRVGFALRASPTDPLNHMLFVSCIPLARPRTIALSAAFRLNRSTLFAGGSKTAAMRFLPVETRASRFELLARSTLTKHDT